MRNGYLTTQEVAERLGITPSAVLRLRTRGTLAGMFKGRTWWFSELAVEVLENSPYYLARSRAWRKSA